MLTIIISSKTHIVYLGIFELVCICNKRCLSQVSFAVEIIKRVQFSSNVQLYKKYMKIVVDEKIWSW